MISSLTSTFTSRTMPESSEPSETVRTGASVPSADTLTCTSPRSTASVTYLTALVFCVP